MAEQPKLDHNSPAVQKHVEVMQGVIERMAVNSRSCKLWCVTLVSAVLVLVARAGEPEYALIALVPAVLFLILDTYYMALERAFRDSYKAFVDKLHGGSLEAKDVFRVRPAGSAVEHFVASLKSFSIWPFYPVLLGMILMVWAIVN